VMTGQCVTLMFSPAAVRKVLPEADLVVGAVLVPGSKTPKLVTREMLGTMKKGAVLVDVSIDQGGCFETSRETTHADPIYQIDGIVHYAVSNMPGALPRTSTLALNNATLPYAEQIASKGWKKAMRQNPEIAAGANVVEGKVTYKGVAGAFGLEYVPVNKLLK
jgi:alanine dehydrogenase